MSGVKIFLLGVLLWPVVNAWGGIDLGRNLLREPVFVESAVLPDTFSVQSGGREGEKMLVKKRAVSGEYTMATWPIDGLEIGKLYRVSIWVKTENISQEFSECCNVEFYEKDKFLEAKPFHIRKGSSDWYELSQDLRIGDLSFSRAVLVFFLQRGVTGTVCFSSPSVREIVPDQDWLRQEYARLDAVELPEPVRLKLEEMRLAYLTRMKNPSADPAILTEQIHLTEWNALCCLFENAVAFEKIRPEVSLEPGFEDVMLGVASGAEKVLPRAPQFHPLPETVKLSAAGNERESFQLVIFPAGRTLREVSVAFSDLTSTDGAVIHDGFQVMPVGYVPIRTFSDYIGFYPDPLMAHLHSAGEIGSGDAQSFWCRLGVPKNQSAGLYRGAATVTIAGHAVFRFPVEVRVYRFSLPDRAMLPLAITFILKEKHLDDWTRLLTEYYITPDNLYNLQGRQERSDFYGPDFDLLARMKADGTLNFFNLGYVDEATENPIDRHGMQFQIDRIRPRYEKAKALGLLDHAYIYGCDESVHPEYTDLTARIVKEAFPDVPLLTTASDRDYGLTGRLSSWDWYCPLIPDYEATLPAIEKARRAGKKVWWYVACYPLKPYPNVFVDYPVIDIRLLMGAMAVKYRPDGFLYYETTNWRRWNPASLGNQLFTDWNPNSFANVNGDGCWFYRGPDDMPLPSLRVENFRDGLEDYAYSEILRQKVEMARNEGLTGDWLEQAEEALQVPDSLVRTLTDYSLDPQELYRYRNRLAELIETAPGIGKP